MEAWQVLTKAELHAWIYRQDAEKDKAARVRADMRAAASDSQPFSRHRTVCGGCARHTVDIDSNGCWSNAVRALEEGEGR